MRCSDRALEAAENSCRCARRANWMRLAAMLPLIGVGPLIAIHHFSLAVIEIALAIWIWRAANAEERRGHTWEYLRHCWVSMDDDPGQREMWIEQAVGAIEKLASEIPLPVKIYAWLRMMSTRSGRRLNAILKRDRTIL